MEGKLMKLKERFIEKDDPTVVIRDYLDKMNKTISEIEQIYKISSTNRNKSLKETNMRVSKIIDYSNECQEILSNYLSGLLPPEDANQSLEPDRIVEALGFVRDVRLWGPKGFTYISGEIDRRAGMVHLPRGYDTFGPAIRRVRAGDPNAPIKIQVGEMLYPVERIVSPDKKDIEVHFDPYRAESPAIKFLDRKQFPRIPIK